MLVNKRDLTVISYTTEYVDTLLSQTLGLMFRLKIKRPLIFDLKNNNKCGNVHMLFVPFSIDIIFLNKKNVIIHMDSLKAWTGRVDFTDKVNTIIELPKYTIINKNLNIGDKLLFL